MNTKETAVKGEGNAPRITAERPWFNDPSTFGNLDKLGLQNVIGRMDEHLSQVIAQRDELLAALKSITGMESYAGEVMQITAKAAIAKAEQH